eukprot:CAMPEP_0180032118 /NCGR_PEP_ID=MMETSP0984-20121128/28282_1 /TAXON_ID=483367 /ORGANISM="non described non described, Strain CCMP 2436" /LENGTH=37 /DNA_ID= /DNA_START= /DNA_END= /DNA_ORIENTATION=
MDRAPSTPSRPAASREPAQLSAVAHAAAPAARKYSAT